MISSKIIIWGTYDLGKPRNRIIISTLKSLPNIDVREIHSAMWDDVKDKSSLSLGSLSYIAIKKLFLYPLLLNRYLIAKEHTHVLVLYPGLFDLLLIWPLAKLRGKKIIFDMFIPIYETVIEDRKILLKDNLISHLILYFEKYLCKLPDTIVLDCKTHAKYIGEQLDISSDKLANAFVGAEDIFAHHPEEKSTANKYFKDDHSLKVLFYGQMIPLHNITLILETVQIVQNQGVEFLIVGSGQEQNLIEEWLRTNSYTNLSYRPWTAYETLPEIIKQSHICLGIFGESSKATNVIPNKVFQCLLGQKVVITRDSLAIREIEDYAEGQLVILKNNSAKSLAVEILKIKENQKILETKNTCYLQFKQKIELQWEKIVSF